MNNEKQSIRNEVMEAIMKGKVHMRPRWHFVLLSALSIVGVILVLLSLTYVVSLSIFALRHSGALSALSFGARGWFALFHTLPWILFVLILLFIILLEVLVRRYAFVYRKSLVTSALVIVALITACGLALERTSMHQRLEYMEHHGGLPGPLGIMYHEPFRMHHPPDMVRGQIVATSSQGLVIFNDEDDATSTILITSYTHLPYGADFKRGEIVVIVGDTVGTGTIHAFGIREIEE